MHQHVYVSQLPVISALPVIKKYEYGYLLKKASFISDLMFFVIKKKFFYNLKNAWRKEYRDNLSFKKIALSFMDKHKLFLTNPHNVDFDLRKPAEILNKLTLSSCWFRLLASSKEWRHRHRYFKTEQSIKYLHIEGFRTSCYKGYYYIYLYLLKYS